MSKLSVACAALLVVAATAATAAAAQAEPYWTSNGKVIHVPTLVNTNGPMTFTVLGTTVKCKLLDEERIENPAGGAAGVDELLTFTLSGCAAKPSPCAAGAVVEIVVTVVIPTHLIDEKPPIRDVIENMELKVECSHVLKETYTGSLKPEVTKSALIFGPGSGSLENATTHNVATVTGTDHLLGAKAKEKIGAEDVEFEPHWYSNGKRIAEGLNETVHSSGALTSHVGAATLKCLTKDLEKIENPVGGGAGTDEVTVYEPGKCVAVPACPAGTFLEVKGVVPWFSELVAGTPIRDEIFGIEIEVNCVGPGGSHSVFKGALTPEVGSSALVYGAGSGELEGPGGSKATITGTDLLKGPAGDTKITAETP